jgi:hypothetical protein
MKTKFLSLTASVLCLMTFMAGAAYSQNEEGPKRAAVAREIKHDISAPLRSMVPVAPERDKAPHEHPVKPIPQPAQSSNTIAQDKALQTTPGQFVAATPGGTFEGVGLPIYSVNAAPPDTNGAMGATQYVQWVNEAFAVYNVDRTAGTLTRIYGPANGNTLWSGFGGPCQTSNDGDPIVQYDKAANRWIMTQFAVTTAPYRQCVAVSTTPDATGSYARYEFTYGNNFNDYPKLGVWPDGYYITYNMFANGSTFAGGYACAFDRTAMLAGAPATQQCFNLGTSFGGLLPSDLDGSTPPPVGSPNYIVNFGTNSLNVWKFHVDWTNPANSTLSARTNLPVSAFSTACGGGACIKQPGTTQLLDSLGDRLMYRLAYRNRGGVESLVVNHSVNLGTTKKNQYTGVRWYELRVNGGTPSVFQQGTFAPDTRFRWMGSAAMDKVGNIGIGYSLSSANTYPSIYFTGRQATDAPGTMGTETNIYGGTGAQTRTLNRWGDYSSLSIDPVDDCTMWFTTEYIQTSGTFNWSTRIGKIKFNNCQ